LEHDLEAAKAEAKSKNFFINALSHDLRTPLNGMMLQAEVAVLTLQEMDQTSEAVMEVAESLRRIMSSAVATAEMLDGLLELGSLDVGATGDSETTFDLGGLLRRVVDASRTVAESKGLELHAEVPEGLLVHTVRAKLERVLLNLTGNALKFTNSGSVRLDVSSSGSEVTIHVTDTGPGIPGEHLPHLFTEYFQGHNDERDRGKGYGLGLAIARRLAVQLGGHIVVASELGEGSRFSVALPDVLAGRKPVASASHAHR